jgi:D-glycero-D-manno-heptose 1,7-bisphosphate phosphatase
MPSKAVFLDRDNTLIEDPGYLADPDGVRILPGVELALKSLAQAGYLLVVVTNQSGIARGLLSEETLQEVHEQMLELLTKKGAHIDEIYYCPYFADGTVPEYAIESDLRKPEPGMLLQAADDLDLDLDACWMVGDSGRDVEAGQRAGCRTIRIRTPHDDSVADDQQESFQSDYTVRNLVEAARVILRERDIQPAPAARADAEGEASLRTNGSSVTAAPEPATGVVVPPVIDEPDELLDEEPPDEVGLPEFDEPEEPGEIDEAEEADEFEEEFDEVDDVVDEPAPVVEAPIYVAPSPRQPAPAPAETDEVHAAANELRQEILREVRQMARSQHSEDFSFWRLAGTIIQVLVVPVVGLTLSNVLKDTPDLARAQVWGTMAVILQVMALTLAMQQKKR